MAKHSPKTPSDVKPPQDAGLRIRVDEAATDGGDRVLRRLGSSGWACLTVLLPALGHALAVRQLAARAALREPAPRRRRRRARNQSRMVQLTLPLGPPSYVRGLDLEPLLRGGVIEAMAAVLLRADEADLPGRVEAEISATAAE